MEQLCVYSTAIPYPRYKLGAQRKRTMSVEGKASEVHTKSEEIKVGWIYKLNKEELIKEAEKLELDSGGSVDELRKRISAYYRTAFSSQDQVKKLKEELEVLKLNLQRAPVGDTTVVNSHNTYEVQVAYLNQVRKWNIRFNGKRNPVEFLENIQELKDRYGISEDNMLNALPELLLDTALDWYRNNKDNWIRWENFIEDFKAYYFPSRYRYHLEEQIRSRKQTDNESTSDYFTAIQTLIRRQDRFSPNEQLERIYNNLLPKYRMHIRRKDFTTLAELQRLVKDFETLTAELEKEQQLKSLNRFGTDYKPKYSNIVRQGSQQQCVPYDTKTHCYRCKGKDHFRKDCTRPFRKFCSQCGKDGIFSKDCCQKQQGNSDIPVHN